MTKPQKFHRRQLVVDKGYQYRFVLRLIGIIVAIAVLTLFVAGVIMWANMYDPQMTGQAHLIDSLLAATLTLSVEVIVALPLLWYFGIRQTHRVVGPLKRMRAALDAIGRGDFSQRIRLRDGDVLIELAEEINLMAERLQRRYPSGGDADNP